MNQPGDFAERSARHWTQTAPQRFRLIVVALWVALDGPRAQSARGRLSGLQPRSSHVRQGIEPLLSTRFSEIVGVTDVTDHVARTELLQMQGGALTDAIETLAASAAVARSQHAVIELARTLAVLADSARKCGDTALAAQADAERAEIVGRIGPEVRGVAWALDLPRARMRLTKGLRSTPGEPSTPLSRRELEVAALLLEGITDRQIADRLVITEGTAGVHVSHILNKLGSHSRTDVASWARQRRLGPKSDPQQEPRGLDGNWEAR